MNNTHNKHSLSESKSSFDKLANSMSLRLFSALEKDMKKAGVSFGSMENGKTLIDCMTKAILMKIEDNISMSSSYTTSSLFAPSLILKAAKKVIKKAPNKNQAKEDCFELLKVWMSFPSEYGLHEEWYELAKLIDINIENKNCKNLKKLQEKSDYLNGLKQDLHKLGYCRMLVRGLVCGEKVISLTNFDETQLIKIANDSIEFKSVFLTDEYRNSLYNYQQTHVMSIINKLDGNLLTTNIDEQWEWIFKWLLFRYSTQNHIEYDEHGLPKSAISEKSKLHDKMKDLYAQNQMPSFKVWEKFSRLFEGEIKNKIIAEPALTKFNSVSTKDKLNKTLEVAQTKKRLRI